MSLPTFFTNQIYYCIENHDNENPLNEGKHNFIYVENFGLSCEFCFLPSEKANYKPMKRKSNNKFYFVEVEN